MPWPMDLQGTQRSYEDQPASLQAWGHQGCHHVSKLALGLNSVLSCWVPGLHPSPLWHTFLTRVPRGVGEEFRDRHHPEWCLTILDEHYNNVKALDALNKELFQPWMGEKETVSDWGVHLSRHLQMFAVSFPEHFPLDHIAKLKHDCFYGGLPKWLNAIVAYLKASTNEKTYFSYLWVAREAEKEEVMEPSHSQMADNSTKTKVMSFFPSWKLKGIQPVKTPAVQVVHLEQGDTDREESDDPNGIEGMTGVYSAPNQGSERSSTGWETLLPLQ